MNGVIMQRVLGFVIATFALSSLSGTPAVANTSDVRGGTSTSSTQGTSHIDVTALLTAARGAPPVMCSLASRALRGYGWGNNASDAPSTPLRYAGAPSVEKDDDDNDGRDALPAADIQQLFAALGSDDACVREMSIRLIGNERAAAGPGELLKGLSAADAGLRTIAALGLGLVEAPTAVDPLVRTLRDADVNVRAN